MGTGSFLPIRADVYMELILVERAAALTGILSVEDL
jgi:hypothetical protein